MSCKKEWTIELSLAGTGSRILCGEFDLTRYVRSVRIDRSAEGETQLHLDIVASKVNIKLDDALVSVVLATIENEDGAIDITSLADSVVQQIRYPVET
jgi:hypothetical protein